MIQNLSRIFFTRVVKSSRGFSIVGVLVASSIGVIVMMGLSGMLSNMNTDISDLKKNVNQKVLVSQINALLLNDNDNDNENDCGKSLSNSISDLEELNEGGAGTPNKDPITFSVLKDASNNVVFDTAGDVNNKEKIKKLYGLEGHTQFQLTCEDKDASSNPDCDCSSGNSDDYPCNKDWSLSLFTMSYKNNIPVYKEIFNQGLKITYESDTDSDFKCHFGTLPVMEFSCGNPTATGNNHFCGHNAGKSNRIGGTENYHNSEHGTTNSFLGYNAGKNNTSGYQNSFFGVSAGELCTSSVGENRFGYDVSKSCNSFTNIFGSRVASNQLPIVENKYFFWPRRVWATSVYGGFVYFFGADAGRYDQLGTYNMFFGFKAGEASADNRTNSFFGVDAGNKNTTGSSNNFFGYNAGKENTTGGSRLNIGNVIYGKVGDYIPRGVTQKGIVIAGDIRVCPANDNNDDNCKEVQLELSSSREYKKNIVPFNEDEKALELLLKTPLFYFRYKEEHPEKQRMGVISEELPKSLQLPKEKGKPIQPDWVSIYGHLWAGIKALHKQQVHIQTLALKKLESLKTLVQTQIKAVREDIKKELQMTQTENQSLEKRFKEFKQETRQLKLEIQAQQEEEEELQQELSQIKKRQEQFQQELKNTKKQLQAIQN